MRGGGTPGELFYRGAKGRLVGQGGSPTGTKISNFDAPPISKSHGEDQKEMWKGRNMEKWKVVAGRLTNLPQSLPTFVPGSHMSPRCLSHGPKAKKWKATFVFFFFKVLFNSFWNFGFLKNARDEKSNMLWKRRKIKWWTFGEGENRKMQMMEERRKIKYETTISLISRREHHILGLWARSSSYLED
jgi:hypothetical protein